MNNIDRVNGLKSLYTKKYNEISNEALAQEIQAWMDKENKEKGYLVGLSPKCNVTQLAEIIGECGKCNTPSGNCSISHMLRNMVALEFIVELMKENKDMLRVKEAMELIEKGYGPYHMIKEFTTRNCKGTWHSPVVEQKG